jgi:23S rRNA pseudouridine1911/1915/1917 synthase
MARFHLEVEVGPRRIRLEEYLFDHFPILSRMYIRDVIRGEKCEVNGRVENKGKRIRTGDFVEIELDLDRRTSMVPEDMPLEIVFEDASLIVVNKRAGIFVHPTHRQKNGTLLNGLSFHLNRGNENGSVRPGLVHRLDKETSGLIVVAKDLNAHRVLSRQFQKKLVEKRYLALVEGVPEKENGTIEAPIGRFAEEKRWDIKMDAKPSETRFRIIEKHTDTSLLELEPITGRTNQLRIHCASIGHPIVGDTGRGGRTFPNLCLHASRLTLRHPKEGRLLRLTATAPEWLEY